LFSCRPRFCKDLGTEPGSHPASDRHAAPVLAGGKFTSEGLE
jgi:hypothetical protein